MEHVIVRVSGRFGREQQVFEYAAIDAPHTAETRIESRPAHRHFVHGKQRDPVIVDGIDAYAGRDQI